MSAGDDFQEGPDVIGCSVRGQKSVDREVPCQDNNAKHTLPDDKYIIAAADGLGSASLSHVGSHTVTQAAVSYVGDRIAGVESLDEKTVQSVLREAFVHAREQLQKEADSRGEPVSKLNTTLLVAVGGPAGAGGAAVGDGGIVCHRGGQTGLLIPREDTEYENKTIPIQSDNWKQSYRFGWVEDVDAAAVFSDGLDGVAWDGPASVSDKLFDQVFGSIRDYSDLDELETFLQDFLDGESIRKSSRDDKTLVVGALPPSEWADPANVDPLPSVGLAGAAAAETTQEAGGPREGAQYQHTEHGSGGVSGASSHQQSQHRSRGGRKGGRRQQTAHGAGGESVGQSSVDERLGGTRARRLAAVAGVVALVVVVVAVAGAVLFPFFGGNGDGGENNVSDVKIEMNPTQPVTAGDTVSFNATAYNRSGDVVDGNNSNFTWSADSGDISETGIFSETTAGIYEVNATLEGVSSNSTSVIVEPAETDRIEFNLTNITTLRAGKEVQFDATAYDQFGNVVDGNNSNFTWSADNGDISETGVFSETTAGTYEVDATLENESSNSTSVTVEPAVTDRIELDPMDKTTVTAGNTLEFDATAYDQFGNVVDGKDSNFMWSASDGSISETGVFDETGAGTYNVEAMLDDVSSDETPVTVGPADVSNVAIMPNSSQTTEIGVPIEFNAIAKDMYGNIVDEENTNFTWSASEGNISESGVFNGTTAGTYEINATLKGVSSNSTNVTVQEETGENNNNSGELRFSRLGGFDDGYTVSTNAESYDSGGQNGQQHAVIRFSTEHESISVDTEVR